MARMLINRKGKKRTYKIEELGKLQNVGFSGNGTAINRIALHFTSTVENGVTSTRTIWLDFDEAVVLIRRTFKPDLIADIFEAAKQKWE